jgi:hypothetical protein
LALDPLEAESAWIVNNHKNTTAFRLCQEIFADQPNKTKTVVKMGCGDSFSPRFSPLTFGNGHPLYLRYAEKPERGRTCDPGRGNRNVELLEAIINHGKVDLDLWRLKKMAERPFRD